MSIRKPKTDTIKKDYLSPETWDLITQREIAATQTNRAKVNDLNMKIRHKAKADKPQHLFELFNFQENDVYRKKAWKTIGDLRKTYKPNNISV